MKKNKTKKKLLSLLTLFAVAVIVLLAVYAFQKAGNKFSGEIALEKAQEIVDESFSSLPNAVSTGAKFVEQNMDIGVVNITYGTEMNAFLECTYSTYDVGSVVSENLDQYILSAYEFYENNRKNNIKTNATKVKLYVTEQLKDDLISAKKTEGNITLELFETGKGVYSLYLSKDVVNTVFGGIHDAEAAIQNANSVEYNGEIINISNLNTLRTGIKDCISLNNYDSKKPDTSVPLEKAWNSFKYEFYRNFIDKDLYLYITRGLGNTIAITFCAVLLGIVIGFVVAIIRCVNQKTGKIELLSDICKLYLSIMRGTPVMVQLLIIYFVFLLPMGVDKFVAAVLCFGFNSGAYVSEIIRGGIMAIDEGQTEAGRSLGFTYMQTMVYIIIPQAFKAVLPALANEFIALLKESSIAFYIGVADLTQGGIKIRSITYSNFMPLIAIAVVYLVVVLGLSKCVSILERRLSKGDKR